MEFKKKFLLIFIPLSIIPVLITVVIFYQISLNEFIRNEKLLVRHQGLSAIERASASIKELKNERLFESRYFRDRMFDDLISSSIIREDDIICIINLEEQSMTAGSTGFRQKNFDHEELRPQIKPTQMDSAVEIMLNIRGVNSSFIQYAGRIPEAEEYLISIMVPVEQITEPLPAVLSALIPVLVMIFVIIFGIILRIATVFTRPLTNLINGVESVSRGELDLQLTEDPKSAEFRILVRAFNKMSRNLNYEMNKREKFEKDLQTSLNEKDILLKEIHHRVKNNMQIISSLLKLQSDSINDEEIIDEFNSAINRINTMALVHEKLYQSRDFTEIDFESYLDELFPFLIQSYSRADIIWSIELENLVVSLDQIISLGLIINELVSNSIKHAPNYPGLKEIRIKAVRVAGGFTLSYQDWGEGPPEISADCGDSLGLDLVKNLAIQLGGIYRIEKSDGQYCQLLTISAPAG